MAAPYATAIRRQAPALSAQAIVISTLTTLTTPCSFFIPGATGNLVCTLEEDSADVTISVLDGVVYPLRIKEFDATNAVAGMALFND